VAGADFTIIHRHWIPELTFAIEVTFSARLALFASLAAVCALDCRLWRIFVVDAARGFGGQLRLTS
jgi:hypothetical protein